MPTQGKFCLMAKLLKSFMVFGKDKNGGLSNRANAFYFDRGEKG